MADHRPPAPDAPLVALVHAAAAHALATLVRGEALVPFLVTEGRLGRAVLEDPSARPEDCLALARWHAATCGPDVDRLALVFDGWRVADGARADAVYVEASETGGPTLLWAVRYVPRRRFKAARQVGPVELVGAVAPLHRAA
jgi:hypothetical protein